MRADTAPVRAILALLAFVAAPAYAQLVYPPASVDLSAVATKTEVQAVAATIPAASNVAPPAVADSSSTGNMTAMYALANHTHASKSRKARVLVPISGVYDVTFATSFTNGVAPLCAVVAEATAGDTNVVNAQIDGPTTATGMRVRVTRTQQSVVALLGLTILSVPTQIATYVHYICIEP